MRRARKLLRACKEINNGPTSIFTDISRIANVIIVAICLINIISIAVLKRDAITYHTRQLS